jgi:cytochrome c
MRRVILSIVVGAMLFVGCDSENTNKPTLNAKVLIKQKCSACHNLDLPPSTYENEKAPPMMAVAFHMKGFMQVSDESMRIPKAIDFVKDYVIAPSAEKSLCDKKSLEDYGVMPSQKGKVTEAEIDAIAHYLFEHYTQKNLVEAQTIQNKLNAMPKGKKLALQKGCMACHKPNKAIIGPSFLNIAKHYKSSPESIIEGIKNGSKGKWNIVKNTMMPSFKTKLTDDEIVELQKWILSLEKR